MTSLFLLLTFGLHQTISYVNVNRQNSVVVDDDDSDNNYDYNNKTGWTVHSTFCYISACGLSFDIENRNMSVFVAKTKPVHDVWTTDF